MQNICVTGAGGYLGSHVVRELLARGYTVRATVRDAGNTEKNGHLLSMSGAAERLTLFSANLNEPGAFEEPLAACAGLVHAAAAVQLKSKNPLRDIVEPTVRGTEHLLDAVRRTGSVKRFALISSVAAVHDTWMRPGHVYSEADWNEDATVEKYAYGLAKVESEKLFHKYCEENPGELRGFAVHPALVVGPLESPGHISTSVSVVRDLLLGKFHGCPRMSYGVVDVRDVAWSLAEGLERGVTGRFILSARTLWLREIAMILAAAYPERRIPTRELPNPVLYLAALFDSRLTFSYLKRNLGYQKEFSNDRVVRELDLPFRDVAQSLRDTCESLKNFGLA